MKLTRRELGILAGTTAVVGTAAPAEAKPNRTDVPMFEVYQDIRLWTCRYCGEKNGHTENGPFRVYRCKNPVCPDEWVDLGQMFSDILEHVHDTGHQILSADDPKERLIGFVAIDDMSGPHVKEWTIRIVNAVRTGNKSQVCQWLWKEKGQRGIGPTDRARLAAFLTDEGRR